MEQRHVSLRPRCGFFFIAVYSHCWRMYLRGPKCTYFAPWANTPRSNTEEKRSPSRVINVAHLRIRGESLVIPRVNSAILPCAPGMRGSLDRPRRCVEQKIDSPARPRGIIINAFRRNAEFSGSTDRSNIGQKEVPVALYGISGRLRLGRQEGNSDISKSLRYACAESPNLLARRSSRRKLSRECIAF